MNILTGGAGFIGSAFLWKLNSEGINDVIVVDKLRDQEKWRNLNGKIFEDFIDKDEFLNLLEGNSFSDIDTIFHLGACTSTIEKDADYLLKNNYAFSRRIAEWCLKKGVKLIYASSAATYGAGELGYSDEDSTTWRLKPLNIYGYSKHLFDLWVLKNNLQERFVGLKFFNVFGPNEYHKGEMRSVVCKAYEQIKKHGYLKLFKSYRADIPDGEQKRDFVYVKDAVRIIFFFYQHKEKFGIYNIGTGRARSFNDLAKATFSSLKRKTKIEYIPMPEDIRGNYQYFTQADLKKLLAAGYQQNFYSLEEAIDDYVKNYLVPGEYL